MWRIFFLSEKNDTFFVKWLQSNISYTNRETTLWYLSLAAVSTFKGQEYILQQDSEKRSLIMHLIAPMKI